MSNIFIKSVLFAIKCEFDKIEHNMNYYNLYKDFIISIRNNLLSFGNYIQHIIDINNDFQDFNKDIENNSIKLIIYIYNLYQMNYLYSTIDSEIKLEIWNNILYSIIDCMKVNVVELFKNL